MKKLTLILLVIIALFGCEEDEGIFSKERCWECEAVCTVMGSTGRSKMTYCGDYSRADARKMAMTMTYSGDGVKCSVECREVK